MTPELWQKVSRALDAVLDLAPAQRREYLDRLRDEAAYWGKVIGTRYGEPFTCREPLGLARLDGLI